MAIFVSDAMTGTNWSDLHLHTGGVGATWARHPVTSGSRWYIYGNKVHCGVPGELYASGVPSSADYTVECDYTIYTDFANISIAGRMSTSAETFYYVYYLSGQLVLASIVGGTITSLGVWVTTQRISVVDSGITAAGRAGVYSITANDAGTGKHIDNFIATDTSIAAIPRSGAARTIGL